MADPPERGAERRELAQARKARREREARLANAIEAVGNDPDNAEAAAVAAIARFEVANAAAFDSNPGDDRLFAVAHARAALRAAARGQADQNRPLRNRMAAIYAALAESHRARTAIEAARNTGILEALRDAENIAQAAHDEAEEAIDAIAATTRDQWLEFNPALDIPLSNDNPLQWARLLPVVDQQDLRTLTDAAIIRLSRAIILEHGARNLGNYRDNPDDPVPTQNVDTLMNAQRDVRRAHYAAAEDVVAFLAVEPNAAIAPDAANVAGAANQDNYLPLAWEREAAQEEREEVLQMLEECREECERLRQQNGPAADAHAQELAKALQQRNQEREEHIKARNDALNNMRDYEMCQEHLDEEQEATADALLRLEECKEERDQARRENDDARRMLEECQEERDRLKQQGGQGPAAPAALGDEANELLNRARQERAVAIEARDRAQEATLNARRQLEACQEESDRLRQQIGLDAENKLEGPEIAAPGERLVLPLGVPDLNGLIPEIRRLRQELQYCLDRLPAPEHPLRQFNQPDPNRNAGRNDRQRHNRLLALRDAAWTALAASHRAHASRLAVDGVHLSVAQNEALYDAVRIARINANAAVAALMDAAAINLHPARWARLNEGWDPASARGIANNNIVRLHEVNIIHDEGVEAYDNNPSPSLAEAAHLDELQQRAEDWHEETAASVAEALADEQLVLQEPQQGRPLNDDPGPAQPEPEIPADIAARERALRREAYCALEEYHEVASALRDPANDNDDTDRQALMEVAEELRNEANTAITALVALRPTHWDNLPPGEGSLTRATDVAFLYLIDMNDALRATRDSHHSLESIIEARIIAEYAHEEAVEAVMAEAEAEASRRRTRPARNRRPPGPNQPGRAKRKRPDEDVDKDKDAPAKKKKKTVPPPGPPAKPRRPGLRPREVKPNKEDKKEDPKPDNAPGPAPSLGPGSKAPKKRGRPKGSKNKPKLWVGE